MSATATVGQLVVESPARARVFERYGIDYCCGGKIPLADACAKKGVDLQQVLHDLLNEDAQPAAPAQDWAAASLNELTQHIVSTHHAYLRQELPRLEFLTQKVVNAHGERHVALQQVHHIFMNLKADMEAHMRKEEEILFPMCQQLDSATEIPEFHCGSLRHPIAVMLREHDDAGVALETMRQLTQNYTPPADACNTYRAMLVSLAQLEADMHQHVHKENNILFPRAIALESKLGACSH